MAIFALHLRNNNKVCCEPVNSVLAATVGCTVCHRLTLDPLSCSACHMLVCRDCTPGGEGSLTCCPSCAKLNTLSVRHRSVIVSLTLQALELKCPHSKDGCAFVSSVDGMQSHLDTSCDYAHPRAVYWRENVERIHLVIRHVKELKAIRELQSNLKLDSKPGLEVNNVCPPSPRPLVGILRHRSSVDTTTTNHFVVGDITHRAS